MMAFALCVSAALLLPFSAAAAVSRIGGVSNFGSDKQRRQPEHHEVRQIYNLAEVKQLSTLGRAIIKQEQ
jgi:hypothetical protein